MSKYQVNWAGKATGPFGEFGNLLVTPIGFTAGADKITIRTTPQVADKVAKAIAGLKGTNLVLTVNAETRRLERLSARLPSTSGLLPRPSGPRRSARTTRAISETSERHASQSGTCWWFSAGLASKSSKKN